MFTIIIICYPSVDKITDVIFRMAAQYICIRILRGLSHIAFCVLRYTSLFITDLICDLELEHECLII